MFFKILSFLFLGLAPLSSACGGGDENDHRHVKRQQPLATSASTRPTRPLEWGDLNIIHTTDTHGWLIGHLKATDPEPNYSGDFGDFQSFVLNMKKIARSKGVDLLVIDSGDLHDGNGFGDNEPVVHPGTVVGKTATQKYISRIPYDVMAIGNHELYNLDVAQDMHDHFAPLWKGRYLSSNVNVTTNGSNVPIGSRVAFFRTEQQRKVTAFGILFNFLNNAAGTVVQDPTLMIKEGWFKEAIAQPTDIFLLAGHMGLADADWKVVFNAVRAVNPTTPILILGGHLHVRDCRQLDSNSMSLASGRYMETIGFMSVKGLGTDQLQFSRRYLDQNRNSYIFHTSDKAHRFDTSKGKKTSKALTKTSLEFNITYSYGTAPQNYYLNRVDAASSDSIGTLLTKPGGVLEAVVRNQSRPCDPLVIVNSGSVRFDIYQGDFTVNDEFIAIPFKNRLVYVPDVPRADAAQLLDTMNKGGASRRSLYYDDDGMELIKTESYLLGSVQHHFEDWRKRQWDRTLSYEIMKETRDDVSFGYVTKDSCPGTGDDIPHKAIPVVPQPLYFGTATPQCDLVDVVFFDFIQSWVLAGLNKGQTSNTYSDADVQVYIEGLLANQILGRYAATAWQSN